MAVSRATKSSNGRSEPAEISFKGMRFLITDRPNDVTIQNYIENLNKHMVKDVVRVCDPTYNKEALNDQGIRVMDWPFDDGSPPPNSIIEQWFQLLKNRFIEEPSCCIAVHCVAGLGRAPVLVALALIELGMKYEDAVHLIRQKRYGAINSKQLVFLENYKSKCRLRRHHNSKVSCCMQ